MVRRFGLVVAVALAMGTAAQADIRQIDRWVKALNGPDEAARASARQMLPRYGAAVVPEVLPLLASESPDVWWAARNVLADVANHVSAPGREAERQALATAYLAELAPDRSAEMKSRVLRLIPIVVTEESDLAPVAALLHDSGLQADARAALIEAGTAPAASALAAAANSATDPAWRAALLDAVAAVNVESAAAAIAGNTNHATEKVRAAAARALARTGDPAYLNAVRGVVSQAAQDTRFDAEDALLRLADAMVRRGGNWDHAMAVYRHLLNHAQSPTCSAAALVALGTDGDGSAVAEIAAAARAADSPLMVHAAIAALTALQGTEAERQLESAFPTLPEVIQAGVIHHLAGAPRPALVPLLLDTAGASDPTLRGAALDALAATGDARAVAPLAAALGGAGDADRAEARVRLARVARQLAATGQREAAGQAYLALYRSAATPEEHAQALEQLKAYPVPEAFDAIADDLGTGALETLDPGVLAGVASIMAQQGRSDDAARVVTALLPRVRNTQSAEQVLQVTAGRPDGRTWAARLGFIVKWHVVGPFPWPDRSAFGPVHVGVPPVELGARYAGSGGDMTWKPADADARGAINLIAALGAHDSAVAYAHAQFDAPEAGPAVLRLGSDDGVRAWLNGELVHENLVDRGLALDQDQTPVQLDAGPNDLVLEITQGAGGWAFCARLTTPDGTPIPIAGE